MHSVAHAKHPYFARGFYSDHTTNHYYLVNEIRKRATPSNTNPCMPPSLHNYLTIEVHYVERFNLEVYKRGNCFSAII